jgi:hypothetical protein
MPPNAQQPRKLTHVDFQIFEWVQPLHLPHGHIAFAVYVLQNALLGPEQQS